MKYKKLTLSFTYEKYSEQETNSLNSYVKNRVYYSLGEFHIYVDFENVEFGKNKLCKELDRKTNETLSKLNKTL